MAFSISFNGGLNDKTVYIVGSKGIPAKIWWI